MFLAKVIILAKYLVKVCSNKCINNVWKTYMYLLTHEALKFSEYDEKIARLEKENKSLKAQIEECKGIKGRHRKLTFSTRRFEKRIFEKILSKIKQDIFKSQISRHNLKYTFFFR